MPSIINASSTGSGGIVQTADASGVLQLQSNGTVAVNILSGTSIAVGSATAYNGGGFGTNMSIYGAGGAAITVVNANEQFQMGANSANNLGFYNPTHSTYMAAMNQYGIGVGTAIPSSGFGVAFPATQSASTDANTLDDYEEGSWTASLYGGTVTGTPVTGSGTYIKVGKLVYARWAIDGFSRPTGASGNVLVGGLPFTVDGSASSLSHMPIGLFINGVGTGTSYNRGAQSLRDVSAGGTVFRLQTNNNSSADVTDVQISDLGTSYNYLRCDFVYQTTA